MEKRQPRIAQVGVVPTLGTAARDELIDRGVPAEAIQVVSTDALSNWRLIVALDQFLSQVAPGERATVVCPEIQTRYFRRIIRNAVGPSRIDRIQLHGLKPPGFHAGNWWVNRTAIAKVAMAYLRLAFVSLQGEGAFDTEGWSPESYEERLRELAHKRLS
jgi:hypothetical protein